MTAISARADADLAGAHLSFGGLLHSEWIKLRTLRSTVWCYLLIVIVTIGMGVLLFYVSDIDTTSGSLTETARSMTIRSATIAISFSQLIAAVLGVLTIGGEYRTGMIRSTLTAAPRRTSAYLAKAIVLTVTTFVVGVVAAVLTVAATTPILLGIGLPVVIGRPDVWGPILAGAVYLALIAVLGFAVGAIVRNTPGGITVVLGLILVAPVIASILLAMSDGAAWAQNVGTLLPSSAGAQMYAYIPTGAHFTDQPGVLRLTAWEGGAVLAAWSVVAGVLGWALLKRRDA